MVTGTVTTLVLSSETVTVVTSDVRVMVAAAAVSTTMLVYVRTSARVTVGTRPLDVSAHSVVQISHIWLKVGAAFS